MDIIRKRKNTLKRKIHPNSERWNGAYSNSTDYSNKIQTLDEYLANEKILNTKKPSSTTFKQSLSKKFFIFSFIFFIFSISFAVGFFIYHTNNTINKITDNNKTSFIKTFTNLANPKSYKSLKGFDDGRINILLLGRANTHKSGKDLTDTIMLLSINTTNYTVGLISIPRDFLINTNNYYVKINSLYQTGLRNNVGTKYITNAVEKITGQKIHYYFILDFEGFKKIINTLGGININVPRHIKDEHYPGSGYSYETFEVWPGLQKFDGEIALKYARTRHDDIEGDFGRAKRQQQVMQSTRNKAFSLGTILNPLKMNELLNILGEHVHTDISPNEIEPFISLVKKLDTQNITNVVLDAWKPESLLISARYYSNHGGISGLIPRIGTYEEIHEQTQNLFNLNKIKQRRKEIENEQPHIIIINTNKKHPISDKIKKILFSLGFKDVIIKKDVLDTQNETIVIDNTKKQKTFSLDELLKKIPATLETQSITTLQKYKDADFVILLGNDIVDMYTYTEISRDELENEKTKDN